MGFGLKGFDLNLRHRLESRWFSLKFLPLHAGSNRDWMMTKAALFFAGLGAVLLNGVAYAQSAPKGNAEAAKTKISMCIGCHADSGYKTAYPAVYSVPMIGGQAPEYIAKALQAYRSGDRNHPSMQGIAKSLSDQDIADLAAYYGKAK